MLGATRDLLQPHQTILDGASVKTPLIPIYRQLDESGISVCSTHLGVVPTHPWRGAKVWICEVGPNSKRAKGLALDLFVSQNASPYEINIADHDKIERIQWMTHTTAQSLAAALRNAGITLEEFNRLTTLSGEFTALSLGRILGQGVEIPTEIIFTQPEKGELLRAHLRGFAELVHALDSEEGVKELAGTNIAFHDDPAGTVDTVFKRAGIVGARNGNIRMCSVSLRVTSDGPGLLRKILEPFDEEGVNLTAIDSMPGTITPEEAEQGIDPDRIVDFDFGIDLTTMDKEKEWRIKEKLRAMGCSISYSGHKLNR